MTNQSPKSRFSKLLASWLQQRTGGFTLIELLVVVIIAGGIVSGLMYLVVELQKADQRESSRAETQREMQLAMNYITTELREAVYIYDGACMAGVGTSTAADFCPGILNHLPTSLTDNSLPVIAFWKQQPLPTAVRQRCAANTAAATTPCLTGSSYSLVVYSLSKSNPNNVWSGNSRITRYSLNQFDNAGNANAGYINPTEARSFGVWPWGNDPSGNGAFVSLQTTRPGNTGIQTLVDFVDDGTGAQAAGVGTWQTTAAACPANYTLTLNTTRLTGAFANANSFYACVNSTTQDSGINRDVVLFLRGNARGRAGVRNNSAFLPVMETRVLSRGVLGKSPGTSN